MSIINEMAKKNKFPTLMKYFNKASGIKYRRYSKWSDFSGKSPGVEDLTYIAD